MYFRGNACICRLLYTNMPLSVGVSACVGPCKVKRDRLSLIYALTQQAVRPSLSCFLPLCLSFRPSLLRPLLVAIRRRIRLVLSGTCCVYPIRFQQRPFTRRILQLRASQPTCTIISLPSALSYPSTYLSRNTLLLSLSLAVNLVSFTCYGLRFSLLISVQFACIFLLSQFT